MNTLASDYAKHVKDVYGMEGVASDTDLTTLDPGTLRERMMRIKVVQNYLVCVESGVRAESGSYEQVIMGLSQHRINEAYGSIDRLRIDVRELSTLLHLPDAWENGRLNPR